MGETQKLRQSHNNIFVEGWVNKIDIKEDRDNNGKEYISGIVEVRTAENNIVPLEVFSYKYKKDGNENAIYKGLQTVKNEYVDATKVEDWTKADYVRVTNGQIRVNEFVNKQQELISQARYNTNFINRINNEKEPKATFSVEIIFNKVRPEIKNEEETGRGFIDGFIVDFAGNLKPVQFTVNEKIWPKIEDEFEKGETLYLTGEIRSIAETKTQVIEMEFGEDEVKTITRVVKERLVKGIKRVDEEKAYDIEDIKKAFEERQKYIKDLKDKAMLAEQQDNKIDDLPF